MAFNSNPVDGEIHTLPDGSRRKWNLARKSWDKESVTPTDITTATTGLATTTYVDTKVAGIATTAPTIIQETASTFYRPDLSTSNVFEYTLDQNSTIGNPKNMLPGMSGKLIVKQDVTGGWTATFGNYFKVPSNYTLNTAPGAYNIFNYSVINETSILLEVAVDVIANNFILKESLVYDVSNIATEYVV